MRPAISIKAFGLLFAAIVCGAGMWLYAQRVLVKHQVVEAATHQRPRGNLSDLYPHWLGAKELLLHGRDPYSPDVTREIQEGFYGRALNPANPMDAKDQERFAYPVYVVFYLAPTVRQPFPVVKEETFWIFGVLTAASVLLWLRVLRWPISPAVKLAIVILTLGSLPAVQGLKLQQMTLLVAVLLALATWLLITDRPIGAGTALALATIKPQLVCIFLLWLLLWMLADWRRRFRWLLSFLLTLAALLAASEFYLPHWILGFFGAVRDYRSYTDSVSVFGKLIPAPWSLAPLLLVAAATAYVGWKNRACAARTPEFAGMAALMLVANVVLIPSYALYNQLLLLPALLWLARESQSLWQGGVIRRGLLLLVGSFLAWQWLSAVVLAGLSFLLPPAVVEKAWTLPFWTVLLLPVGVAALVLVAHIPGAFAAHEKAVAS
jgi:hypothetical protein